MRHWPHFDPESPFETIFPISVFGSVQCGFYETQIFKQFQADQLEINMFVWLIFYSSYKWSFHTKSFNPAYTVNNVNIINCLTWFLCYPHFIGLTFLKENTTVRFLGVSALEFKCDRRKSKQSNSPLSTLPLYHLWHLNTSPNTYVNWCDHEENNLNSV